MPSLQLSAFFMNHDGRGLTWSSVFLASLVVWVPSGIALTACNGRSDVVDAPVVAGVDSPDEDLAQFLNGMIQDARSLPTSGLMRGRLAMAYENNLFPDEALISYAQAAALDPEDFRWPYFSAQLKGRHGLYQVALDDLERAIEIDADYAPAWLWRGTWLLDLDRPGEAMTAFERAHALGADKEASFGRARVLIAQEKHADAVTLLEPLARDYRHPYIYRTLGFALRALGRMEEARTAVALGRAADPLSWRDPRAAEKAAFVRGIGRFSFAQNLLGAGKVDEALEILETLRGEQPDETCGATGQHATRTCEILNTLTLAYVRAGREDEAFALVQRGLSINPDFFPFHLNIADRYRHRRELDNALHHIERAIALNPSLGYGYEQRGRLLIGLGRYDEAMTALEMALRLAPERPATLLYLGMVEGELERWPQAIEHLRRAIRLDPGFAVGHAYLARSLGETGRIDEAWQAFRMAEEGRAPAYELEATERRLKELESAL